MSVIGMIDEPYPGWEGLETICGLYSGQDAPPINVTGLNYTDLLDGEVKCELFAEYPK